MTENELLLEQLVRIGNATEFIQTDLVVMQSRIDKIEVLVTIIMCLLFYKALLRWVTKN